MLCNAFLSQTLLVESATVQFQSLSNSLVDHVTPATSLDTMRLPVCPLAWLQVTYFQRPQNAHDILGLIASMLVGDCAACSMCLLWSFRAHHSNSLCTRYVLVGLLGCG